MGIDVLLDAWGEIADELPSGSTLLIAGDGPARRPVRRACRARATGRRSADARADIRRSPDRSLPRGRCRGRADARGRGLRFGGARGGGMWHAQHRQRCRRAARGDGGTGRLADNPPGERGGSGRASTRGGAGRVAEPQCHPELRRALLLAATGRAPSRALSPPGRGPARRAAATRRLSRPCGADVRRGDRDAATAAAPGGRARPRHPRRGRTARRAPAAGGHLRGGAALPCRNPRSAPGRGALPAAPPLARHWTRSSTPHAWRGVCDSCGPTSCTPTR